jgi:hypothetical protein
MKTKPLATLLWKDWKAAKTGVLISLVMLSLPFLIVPITTALSRQRSPVSHLLFVSGLHYSQIMMMLALPLMSGVSFARERSDRSADFVATLPVSSPKRFLSKLIVTLAFLMGVCALHWMGWGIEWALRPSNMRPGYHPAEGMIGTYCLAVVGGVTAWLFSTMLTMPIVATGLGIATTMSVPYALTLYAMNRRDDPNWLPLTEWVLATAAYCLCLLAVSFVIYVKRSRP